MGRLLLGLAVALAAAGLYGLCVAVQSLEARAVAADCSLRLSLLGRLVVRPRWLLGCVIGLVAWAGQAAALLLAPLSIVLGLATKFAADDLSGGALVGLALWLAAVGVAACLGMLGEMSVLQRRPASRTAPVVFSTMIAVPVVLAPALAGERWSSDPLTAATLAASLLVMLAATASLARLPVLARVVPAGVQPVLP